MTLITGLVGGGMGRTAALTALELMRPDVARQNVDLPRQDNAYGLLALI